MKGRKKWIRECKVAVTCLECGELILVNGENQYNNRGKQFYHKECFRRKRSKDANKRRIPKEKEKHICIQCYNIFETAFDNRMTCPKCSTKQREYYRSIKNIVVAVTCINCNKLILCNKAHRKYCDECGNIARITTKERRRRWEEAQKLTEQGKTEEAKAYIKRCFGKQIHEKKIEALGTYDTCNMRQNDTSKIKRKKNGEPDFEKEAILVKHLKAKTLCKNKGRGYTPTEGDHIRNPKECYD